MKTIKKITVGTITAKLKREESNDIYVTYYEGGKELSFDEIDACGRWKEIDAVLEPVRIWCDKYGYYLWSY